LVKKQQQDELIAFNLQEEERRKKQLEDDELLAKKLMEEEKRKQNLNYSRIPPPPGPYNGLYSSYSQFTPYSRKSGIPSYSMVNSSVAISTDKRQHALTIHNSFCSCGKTSTWNNNHIFDVHTRYCGCDLFNVRNYFNQGKKHEHDYRCCTMNHLHMISCKCYYRDHIHDESCCQIYHKHTVLCHCTHK